MAPSHASSPAEMGIAVGDLRRNAPAWILRGELVSFPCPPPAPRPLLQGHVHAKVQSPRPPPRPPPPPLGACFIFAGLNLYQILLVLPQTRAWRTGRGEKEGSRTKRNVWQSCTSVYTEIYIYWVETLRPRTVRFLFGIFFCSVCCRFPSRGVAERGGVGTSL